VGRGKERQKDRQQESSGDYQKHTSSLISSGRKLKQKLVSGRRATGIGQKTHPTNQKENQ